MLRAILFDVDGTLVDSVDLHARCWQEAFARYGKQLSLPKIRAQIGKGGDQLIPFFLTEEEDERWGEALSAFRTGLFMERYLPLVTPFPGVRELFGRIRRGGKRIALASSAKEDEVDHYVSLLGVEDLVDALTTRDDVERSKPHPDVFEAALKKVGVESAAEALAVGDSPFDAEASGRIGLRTIGLRCGGFPDEDLLRAGCFVLYDSPEALLSGFDRSPLSRDEHSELEQGAPG